MIFGSRRYRAAKAARLEAIPARIVEMDDLEMLEVQIAENSQRSDVHPLEEADAYRQLNEVHKKTVAEISARVGRSSTYIYQRLKLCALVEPARKLFFAGKLTAATALIVARIDSTMSR